MSFLNEELQQLSEIIRTVVSDCNNLDYNFEDWCKGSSSLMWYIINKKYNLSGKDNYIALGTYKDNGHYWNVINGIIVDTTVDQFARIKTGIVTSRTAKNYKQKATMLTDIEDIKYLMSEEIDYINDIYRIKC